MSAIRLLVGTRKGAFVMTSDARRQRWDISGPHFGGWEVYHLKGSPVDPRIGCMRRSPAAGSGRLSSAPTTVARRGSRSATNSHTQEPRALTCGMTARRTPGSSSESGISNRR
jgi:hypothetical protein